MKRANPIQIVGFVGFFVVIVFLLGIVFLNQIKSEISNVVSLYGYPAIFFVALIVEALAQPIGPEVPLISGKVLGLNMVYVSLIVIIGSILATFVNYKIGGFFYDRICEDKRCEKYLELYRKYGKYGLFIAAIGPVPYVPFCWFSGAFGMKIDRFVYYGLVPRIIRIIVVGLALGFFF